MVGPSLPCSALVAACKASEGATVSGHLSSQVCHHCHLPQFKKDSLHIHLNGDQIIAIVPAAPTGALKVGSAGLLALEVVHFQVSRQQSKDLGVGLGSGATFQMVPPLQGKSQEGCRSESVERV